MRGKGIRAVVLGFLLLFPLFVLLRPSGQALPRPTAAGLADQSWQQELDRHVTANFPFASPFEQIQLNLLLASGQSEQNGIFITGEGLIRRIGPEEPEVIAANIEAIKHLSEETRQWDQPVPVFVALLPTSAAILQEQLPRFSNTVNQRQLIDDAYTSLTGHATSINAYQQLLARRSQNIYYRTEDNLTSLGGYYVYTQMISRMLNTEAPTLASFDQSYPRHDYYGDLYRVSPYRGVEPDVLTLFHYNQYRREYTVTHTSLGGRKTYHTLFPEHLITLGRDMDVFLGGLSAVTDIRSSAPYSRSLLILGDKTALAYAPFLANHYGRVTVVDLLRTDIVTSGIHAGNYSQVLFAYSTDTFMTKELPADLLERLVAIAE